MKASGLIAGVSATTAAATSLADVYTTSHVRSALLANGTLFGLSMTPSSVTANPAYNASTSG